MAAGGDDGDNGIIRYRYYNASGTWTAEAEATSSSLISDKLLAINHSSDGEMLYSSTTGHDINDISIYKAKVPRHAISADEWLFYPEYEFDTTVPWNSKDVTNVTHTLDAAGYTKFTIAAGFTTGVAGVLNLDPPLDLRQGKTLVAEVKTEVSGGIATGNYEFIYDDVADMGLEESPDKVLKADYSYVRPPSEVYFIVDADGASPTYTALDEARDQADLTWSTISVTADDLFCVAYSSPFNKFDIDFGATVNAIADRTLTAYYSNGDGWTSLSATDNTKTADNGTFKTFAQDGTVAWNIPEDHYDSIVRGLR